MKYIDADNLKAEIERRMDKHWEGLPDADSSEDDWTHNELCELGAYNELENLETFVNSFQQEQPEVEPEKASRNVYESWKGGTMDDFLRDMVELGKALNARKRNSYENTF